MSSIGVLLLACCFTGSSSTGAKQYPMMDQESLLGWPQSDQPANRQQELLRPQQFLQRTIPALPQDQFLQSSALPPLQLAGTGSSTGALAEESQRAFSQNLQGMAGSVPMQQVMQMMQSVSALQRKTAGLQNKLQEAQAHEQQLNDVARSATSQSNQMDQKARKLAHLAQESVSQAQQSINHEKTVVSSVKTKLSMVEKQKDALEGEKAELVRQKYDLQQQLSNTQAMFRSLQNKEASERTVWQHEKQELTQKLSKLQPRQEALATDGIDSEAQSLQAAMERLTATQEIADKEIVEQQAAPRASLHGGYVQANIESNTPQQFLAARGITDSLQQLSQPKLAMEALPARRDATLHPETGSASLAQTSVAADESDWQPAALWTPDGTGFVASTETSTN